MAAPHAKNAVLMQASIVASLIVAEGIVRFIDGYNLLALPLSEPIGERRSIAKPDAHQAAAAASR
jgi:hypothetical protein